MIKYASIENQEDYNNVIEYIKNEVDILDIQKPYIITDRYKIEVKKGFQRIYSEIYSLFEKEDENVTIQEYLVNEKYHRKVNLKKKDTDKFYSKDILYDIETFPNLFSITFIPSDGSIAYVFEISERRDDRDDLLLYLDYLSKEEFRLVGFNNIAFDYPVVHYLMKNRKVTYQDLYTKAQEVIESFGKNKFGTTIQKRYVLIEQLDLFKVNHFDNKAKSTPLKIIEFNMGMDNVIDLPYDYTKDLTESQMTEVISYNINDVKATLLFYYQCYDALVLRESLSNKYGIDFSNMSDSKIGSEIFIQELEDSSPGICYEINPRNKSRSIRQTPRRKIFLQEVILPYVNFTRPEFKAIKDWFSQQVITSTNGVFTNIPEHKLGEVAQYTKLVKKQSKKMDYEPTEREIDQFLQEYPLGWVEDRTKPQEYSKRTGKPLKAPNPNFYFCWNEAPSLSVIINDHEYVFGVGGLHSSVPPSIIESDDEFAIIDYDVASFYPHLAIQNTIYPEHLSSLFCDIYEKLYIERKSHPKNSPENAALKLALNGTYGNSNNQYSPFYDPKYTMTITVNGQLSLCMLLEKLMELEDFKSIQSNTDGITVMIRRKDIELATKIIKDWETLTKLQMEDNLYSKMIVRDVNNYLALYEKDGRLKTKGAYEVSSEHHKDQSMQIVKKAAVEYLIKGTDIEEFIKNHDNILDFMIRTKIPRNFRLVTENEDESDQREEQRVSRFYVSNGEGSKYLYKLMPPLKGKTEDRKNGICKGFKVKMCNDIKNFDNDIDYEYYIEETKKLVDIFDELEEEDEQ